MTEINDASRGFEAGQKAKPDCVTEEHLEFLDELRESGDTNMFGARPYLQREFRELTAEQAGAVLSYWMSTFSERHPT